MSTITLPVGALLKFNYMDLSEHNRRPISLGYTRIEQQKRMSNGSLRKYHVTDKKRISVSWDMLPSYSNFTVDGGFGALDLKKFYEGTAAKAPLAFSGKNSFDVTVKYVTPDGATSETLEMMFTSFSCDLLKRNVQSDIVRKSAKITAVSATSTTITYTAANTFVAGDIVTVTGLQDDLYNVYNATVASASSTSFTVTKNGARASITEASSGNNKFTYYASNTFAAGDVISISGFNTSVITGASTANGKITYSSTAHGFKVDDVINITGVSKDVYNIQNAVILEVTTNSFSVAGTATDSATFSGAQASLVYNKTNVEITSATDYFFTVSDSTTQPTVVLGTAGLASLYSELTQFSVTEFEPVAGTSVKYTSANHDLVVNDIISISGIRSTATITNAQKLEDQQVIPSAATVDAVKLTDNVATVYFSDSTFNTYPWNIGDSITISNCSNSVFNGTYTVTDVPTNFSVSFAKTNADIPLDSSATGDASNNTWSGGMIKYTASNNFVRNDIVSISGITPNEYNTTSARIAYATSSYFLIPGDISVKYRKPGVASSIFNLQGVQINAKTKDTFTVPFSGATGSVVKNLTNVTVSKTVDYQASVISTSKEQEFWSVSLSLDEV